MPIPGYLSSDTGTPSTRFKAVTMSGTISDGGAASPIPPAGGLAVIQSTASIVNQIVTTSATGLARASFIYIPVTTGALTASATPPPYVGCGTPLVWNDTSASLMVWSSSRAAWLTQTVTSSALLGDGKGFTSTV